MKSSQANLYRAYRQLERMLFRGVPERPESMWEREGSNESTGRVTGKPLVSSNGRSVSLEGAQTLATITYDLRVGRGCLREAIFRNICKGQTDPPPVKGSQHLVPLKRLPAIPPIELFLCRLRHN